MLGVIKGNLDTTMAAFIIAVGAAASGLELDMFFTLWATAVLRDPKKDPGPKRIVDRLFGWMLPRGCRKLPLSKMQMGGIGPHVIRHIMKKHNTLPMAELVKNAGELGVRIHVGEMSMEQGTPVFLPVNGVVARPAAYSVRAHSRCTHVL